MIAHSSLFHRARGAVLAALAVSMAAALPAGAVPLIPGNLYVSNFGNSTIETFTPGGVGSVFANTGLSGPFFLAFDNTVMPEPASLALFAAGLLGLGVVRRRRTA